MIFESLAAYRTSGFRPRVAVIGAGPAGITLARKLAALHIPVVLIEAGSDDFSDDSQDFYRGRTVGDPYFDLDVARLRYLGGTSNHWAGWCRRLDALDFEPKPWASDTGWPIRRTDLDPYYEEARGILELPSFEPDEPISDDMRWVQLIKSPAVHFGEKYRDELDKSATIAVVLNTYVTDLVGDGRRVTGLSLWTNGAAAGSLAADYVVVAVGGLENSRLLLWSNERGNGAVVPQSAALGRYWMEHPTFEGGNVILTGHDHFTLDKTHEAFFSPTAAAMQRLGILNFGIRLIETPYSGMKALAADLACKAPNLAEWTAAKLGDNLRCAAQLYVAWEQQPRPDNCVALSKDDRDPAGVPRIELHWKKGPLEHRTFLEGLRLFGKTMAEKDYGRVRIADWIVSGAPYPDNQELAGYHHMGGTRMGTDPGKSVVDADCRVHGMDNLYVGGSSVFCTSGHGCPTITITALALRLGEHLGKVVVS